MVKKYTFLLVMLITVSGCQPKVKLSDFSTEPRCIASQSKCEISNDAGQFLVHFNQSFLIAETPFQITVVYNGDKRIASMSSYMQGADMFMGKIPLIFTPVTQNQNVDSQASAEQSTLAGQQLISDGLFGACSERQMKWQLWFDVAFDDGSKEQFFIYVTSYQSSQWLPLVGETNEVN